MNSKPSILSGLLSKLTIPVPNCFSLDFMHLPSLNIPELLISLWHGTLKHSNDDHWDWATFVRNVWTDHGKVIENATHYFPSLFHRTPQNSAEKISSGYKATECFLYIYGLGPVFFWTILSHLYWQNFCKLVAAIQIFVQWQLTGSQIAEGQSLLIQFIEEYEAFYYQKRIDQLQVCCLSVHTLIHLASEILQVGPGAYYSQFTMEQMIGSLGKEIRQPSSPFANLSQWALLWCQINALVNIYPDLEVIAQKSHLLVQLPPPGHPILLSCHDKYPHHLQNPAYLLIFDVFNLSKIRQWSHIQLPNGQIACSILSDEKHRSNTCVSHNVKANTNILTISKILTCFTLDQIEWAYNLCWSSFLFLCSVVVKQTI